MSAPDMEPFTTLASPFCPAWVVVMGTAGSASGKRQRQAQNKKDQSRWRRARNRPRGPQGRIMHSTHNEFISPQEILPRSQKPQPWERRHRVTSNAWKNIRPWKEKRAKKKLIMYTLFLTNNNPMIVPSITMIISLTWQWNIHDNHSAYHLVGGWASPLKNMKVSWDDCSQNMQHRKNVPNYWMVNRC